MRGLKSVFTVSRNTLMTLKNGKLYNNAFAINELEASLAPLLDYQWDSVINLTNNRASAYLCSWLKSRHQGTTVFGASIDSDNMVRTSDAWASVFNDILPMTSNAPFNFRDVWAQMLGFQDRDAVALLTNNRNEENVKRHFETMRTDGSRVIGIQLVCSVPGKGIHEASLIKII